MKKYKIYKNGKLIVTSRFYSIDHVKKFLEKKYDSGTYEVQELSVYKDLDVQKVKLKERAQGDKNP